MFNKNIDEVIENLEYQKDDYDCCLDKEDCDMAIEALKKQIPIKPIANNSTFEQYEPSTIICRICGHIVGKYSTNNYCRNCGQRLCDEEV